MSEKAGENTSTVSFCMMTPRRTVHWKRSLLSSLAIKYLFISLISRCPLWSIFFPKHVLFNILTHPYIIPWHLMPLSGTFFFLIPNSSAVFVRLSLESHKFKVYNNNVPCPNRKRESWDFETHISGLFVMTLKIFLITKQSCFTTPVKAADVRNVHEKELRNRFASETGG